MNKKLNLKRLLIFSIKKEIKRLVPKNS